MQPAVSAIPTGFPCVKAGCPVFFFFHHGADGSAYYDTHDNVLIYKSSSAAYGGNSLKSDFGGHSNFHHGNLDLFYAEGFGIAQAVDGFQDG